MISWMIHKISCYKVRVSTGVVETRWLGGSFLMVYRNNAGRLGSGFIIVCLATRWLGQKRGFYVPKQPFIPTRFYSTFFWSDPPPLAIILQLNLSGPLNYERKNHTLRCWLFHPSCFCSRHLLGVERVCCSVFSVVTATYCNTLHATQCNTLQCTAMHFNTPRHKNTIKAWVE